MEEEIANLKDRLASSEEALKEQDAKLLVAHALIEEKQETIEQLRQAAARRSSQTSFRKPGVTRSPSALARRASLVEDDGSSSLLLLSREKEDSNGILVVDKDVTDYAIAVVIHDGPTRVLDYLFSDVDKGNFKRHTIHTSFDKQQQERRVVFWQCGESYTSQTVSFLLLVRTSVVDSAITISIDSIDVSELSEAEGRLSLLRLMASIGRRDRVNVMAKINRGRLTLAPHEHGQTFLSFGGIIAINEKGRKAEAQEPIARTTTNVLFGQSRAGTDFLRLACKSIYDIVHGTEKNFSQPEVIDARNVDKFASGELVAPQSLSEQETEMLNSMRSTEEEVRKGARRVAGTARDPIEKFLLLKDDGVWGLTSTTIDVSAKELFTRLWVLDTYEKVKQHKENNGSLPREVLKNIAGTRGQQYRVAQRYPSPFLPRFFDTWMTWDKVKNSEDDSVQFMIVWAPTNQFLGTLSPIAPWNSTRTINAISTGMHSIVEIAPNVCKWLQLTYVESKTSNLGMKLSTKVIFKTVLGDESPVLREVFKRNDDIVRKEVRDTIVRKMDSGEAGSQVEPTRDEEQAKVFAELERIVSGAEWKKSSNVSSEDDTPLRMYTAGSGSDKPHNGDRKPLCMGKTEGILDISAKEAVAWFFDFCGHESLEVGRRNKTNEKILARIEKYPFPFVAREYVSKIMWRATRDSASIAIWPVDDVVDYGYTNKAVRGTWKGLLTATNLDSIGDVKQCKVTYSLVRR